MKRGRNVLAVAVAAAALLVPGSSSAAEQAPSQVLPLCITPAWGNTLICV